MSGGGIIGREVAAKTEFFLPGEACGVMARVKSDPCSTAISG
jgi:hypothetical protein